MMTIRRILMTATLMLAACSGGGGGDGQSYGLQQRQSPVNLGFPTGVTIIGEPADMVINMRSDRWVPLKILFQSQKCLAADEIHWCACRETLKSLDGMEWKGEYLHKAEVKKKSTAYFIPSEGAQKQSFTSKG